MKILDFAFVLGSLKKTKRTGWVREKVPNPESIAEHSFRMAVLAMILAPKVEANTTKAIKMALVHDIGEAEIGDIVTTRGIQVQPNLQDKIENERKALVQILNLVEGEEYVEIFDEFEKNQTIEARLVKQIDKLEMAIQALEYENEHKLNLQEFFDDANSKIHDENVRKIMNEILELRDKS